LTAMMRSNVPGTELASVSCPAAPALFTRMSNSALPVRLVSSASRVLNSALISAGCSSRARIGTAAARELFERRSGPRRQRGTHTRRAVRRRAPAALRPAPQAARGVRGVTAGGRQRTARPRPVVRPRDHRHAHRRRAPRGGRPARAVGPAGLARRASGPPARRRAHQGRGPRPAFQRVAVHCRPRRRDQPGPAHRAARQRPVPDEPPAQRPRRTAAQPRPADQAGPGRAAEHTV